MALALALAAVVFAAVAAALAFVAAVGSFFAAVAAALSIKCEKLLKHYVYQRGKTYLWRQHLSWQLSWEAFLKLLVKI